jgi:tetratricopeptide (TPR) repeat protein
VAARTALERDEFDAEAHVALGWISGLHDWHWEAAERAFERAINLSPSHALAHMHLAHLLNSTGRHQEALVHMTRARELDPLSAHILWSLPQAHMHAGGIERAVEECRKGIDLYPDFWPLHTLLGGIFVWQGRDDRALTSLQHGVELSKDHPHALAMLGSGHALAGRRREALAIVAALEELSQRRYFSPAEKGWVFASLGQAEPALACLERAYEERSPWMTRLRLLGPTLGDLPTHPRFQDLLRRMAFPR